MLVWGSCVPRASLWSPWAAHGSTAYIQQWLFKLIYVQKARDAPSGVGSVVRLGSIRVLPLQHRDSAAWLAGHRPAPMHGVTRPALSQAGVDCPRRLPAWLSRRAWGSSAAWRRWWT